MVASINASTSAGVVTTADTSGILQLQTASTAALTIDASQNVGIGITPSAFASSRKALQVGGSSTVATLGLSSGVGEVVYNTYYDGTNFKYINTNYAASFDYNNAATGGFAWRLAPSGTAGNNVTFTEAMRIDSSGNVGIGTSSPSSRLGVTTSTAGYASIITNTNGASDSNGLNIKSGTGSTEYNLRLSNTSGSADFMVVKGNGKVGIGTTAPDSALHISGSAVIDKSDIKLTNTDSSGRSWRIGDGVGGNPGTLTFFDSTAGAGRVKIDASGYLYCPAAYGLTTGNAANCFIASDGSFQRSTSSLKYKKNVANATHGLTDLLKLRSVTYEGKADGDAGKTFGGLIAEEVDALGLTEFVQYAEDGSPDALAYGNMVALCVKSIQELKAINDTQAETINALTARIVALEK